MGRLASFLSLNVDIVVGVIVGLVVITIFIVSRRKKLPPGLPVFAAILGILGIFVMTRNARKKVLQRIEKREAKIAEMKATAEEMKTALGASETELKRILNELDQATAAHARTLLELEEAREANRERVEKLSDVEAIEELAGRLAALKDGG